MVFRKKKWMIVGIIAAIVVLVAGIVGGVVVYAQSTSTPSNNNTGKSFADRVATILGLDQTTVENAFTQARKEMKDEALTNRLNSLVAQGKLTQQQADQYKSWWESRPDVPAISGLQGPRGFRGGFRCPPGFGQPAPSPTPSTPSSTQ